MPNDIVLHLEDLYI